MPQILHSKVRRPCIHHVHVSAPTARWEWMVDSSRRQTCVVRTMTMALSSTCPRAEALPLARDL